MPRASYGDKFTVTVIKNSGGGDASEDGDEEDSKHVVLDLTSKVVDFLLVPETKTLLVLAEEELVAVDLTEESWPPVPSPYLNAIHASAITCLAYADNVAPDVVDRLRESATKDKKGARATWPADGGKIEDARSKEEGEDLLITGHEDGSVKIWSCSGVSLAQLATVRTNRYFVGDELDEPPADNGEEDEDEEDEWPPFRKVGHFDPYSDDPRLAIKKVAFCGKRGRLVVGGTAGQVLVLDLVDPSASAVPTEDPVKVKADLVTEKEGFTWKGHQALAAREKPKRSPASTFEAFVAKTLLQISPPASINSLAVSTSWGVVAAGTAHGLVMLDSTLNCPMVSKCTLNAQGNNFTGHFFL